MQEVKEMTEKAAELNARLLKLREKWLENVLEHMKKGPDVKNPLNEESEVSEFDNSFVSVPAIGFLRRGAMVLEGELLRIKDEIKDKEEEISSIENGWKIFLSVVGLVLALVGVISGILTILKSVRDVQDLY